MTNVAQRADRSFATIRNPQSGHQGAFGVGDAIPVLGGGPIKTIGSSSVVFHNPATNRLERLSLLPPETASKGGSHSQRKPQARATGRGVKQLGPHKFELDRDLVTRALRNPRSVRGARFRPYARGGKLLGFRAYGVRRGSLPAAMGLRAGDIIVGANGEALDSMDALLGFYRKLKELNRVDVSIQRRGKPVELTYVLR